MKKKLPIIIFAVLFAALFLLPAVPVHAAGTATVSVEASVVGAGDLVSPTAVETDGTLSGADAVLRLLAENGYTAFYGGTPEASFYLAYVADGDKTGSYNGYRSAAALYPVTNPKRLRFRTRISDPLKAYLSTHAGFFDETDYETNSLGYLGEFVYTDLSGWMYSLNGVFAQKDLASVKLKAGDTLRVRFTLCLGADLGGADPDVQAAFDEAMRAGETTTEAPGTTAPPETTTRAPETTTRAPETTTKAPETTSGTPETTTKAPETTTAEESTSAAETATAAQESTSGEETPSSTQDTATEETPSAPEPERSTETRPAADDGAQSTKRLSGVQITVITAAAAVPVAAIAAIIVKKKKKGV